MNREKRRRDGHQNAAQRSYLRALLRWWRGAGAHIRNAYNASMAFEYEVWPRKAPFASHLAVRDALARGEAV